MNSENNDHFRYMPPGSVPEAPEKPEDVEVTEEIIIASEPEISSRDTEVLNVRIKEKEEERDNERDYERGDEEARDVPLILKILYGIVSPVLVPTYASLFIFLLSVLVLVVPEATAPYTLTVFGATCIVPLIAIYVLMKVGALTSFEMYDPRERTVPYVIEFLALGGTTLFFLFKGANPWIWTIFCGATAVALVNFLINFRMRISNHCSAMAALVATLIVINQNGIPQVPLFWWMVGALAFCGFAGSMAIWYGRHSIWEVLAGYATGFLGVILFSLIH